MLREELAEKSALIVEKTAAVAEIEQVRHCNIAGQVHILNSVAEPFPARSLET